MPWLWIIMCAACASAWPLDNGSSRSNTKEALVRQNGSRNLTAAIQAINEAERQRIDKQLQQQAQPQPQQQRPNSKRLSWPSDDAANDAAAYEKLISKPQQLSLAAAAAAYAYAQQHNSV